MLLFDRILSSALMGVDPQGQWNYPSWDPLKEAIVIKADNISAYEKENVELFRKQATAPPMAISPFESCFIDTRCNCCPYRVGVHVGYERVKAPSPRLSNYPDEIKNNAVTIMLFHFFFASDKGITICPFSFLIFMDRDCHIINEGVYYREPKETATEMDKRNMWYYAHLSLFIFSLMNCKNTIIVDSSPPNNIQKKMIRRGEAPLVKYKTILIDQTLTKHILPVGSENIIHHKAFHIVRGHFATYNGNGKLFGKHTGTFWRPQQHRGQKAHGTIVKDYKV